MKEGREELEEAKSMILPDDLEPILRDRFELFLKKEGVKFPISHHVSNAIREYMERMEELNRSVSESMAHIL